MTEVWLPSSSADSRGLGDLAGTTMLCRLLDLPTPRVPDLDDQLATAVDHLGVDSLPVLLVAHLNKVTMATTKGQPLRRGDVFAAAADEFVFRITGDSRYRDAADDVLHGLAVGTDLYEASPSGDSAAPQPSVVATAIAHWISRKQMSMKTLQDAGLCSAAGACGFPGTNSPIDSPLQATAAVTAVSRPDAASFPLGI